MKFKKGQYILVKENSEDSEVNMTGFGGRIQRIIKNKDETIIKVVWDSLTLSKFTDEYIKWMIENDNYLFDYNFAEDEIEPANPRDTPEDTYTAQEKLYDRKLSFLQEKPPVIEQYYDRFVLSSFYEKLSGVQMDKSWDIINIFSSIMLNKFGKYPDEWDVQSFSIAYTTDFQDNVVAGKDFFKSSKKVLLAYLQFLNYRLINFTVEMQNFLKSR